MTPAFRLYFAVALLFNFCSFQSLIAGNVGYTATDPLLGSIILVILAGVLEVTARYHRKDAQHLPHPSHTFACCGTLLALAKYGIFAHIMYRQEYLAAEGLHSTLWMLGVAINLYACVILCVRLADICRITLLQTVLLTIVFSHWTGTTYPLTSSNDNNPLPGRCSDIHYDPSIPQPFDGSMPHALPHLPFNRTSSYLEMSDGVKLAVDVYLPRGMSVEEYVDPNKGHPTFLHFTRYRRAEKRSWLTRWFILFGQPPQPTITLRSLRYIEHFVSDGYAFVTVDTRGAGASYGHKPVDMMPREVQDLKEVSDWVINQPFCDGNIASGGISYDGMMAASAAAQGNIKAIALVGFFGSLYEDIAAPGGLPASGFIDSYAAFTSASERNIPVSDPVIRSQLPWKTFHLQEWLFDGTAGVDGDDDEVSLHAAVAEHADNYDMKQKSRNEDILCVDDVVATHDGEEFRWTDISNPVTIAHGLVEHNVSVSNWAGYYDSGSLRGSLRMHNDLLMSGGRSRLIAGPWSHGVRSAWTPRAGPDNTAPSFDLYADIKRFVDCSLREINCGNSNRNGNCDSDDDNHNEKVNVNVNVNVEAEGRETLSLQFFMSGGDGPDEWHAAGGTWPPQRNNESVTWHDLWLRGSGSDSASGILEESNDEASGARVGDTMLFTSISTATSGLVSRWNLVQALMMRSITYTGVGSSNEDGSSMLFVGEQVTSGLNMVGSALMELSLTVKAPLDARDAAIFVYLEDISPDGTVHYVTEGQVRASHASITDYSKVGAMDAVTRTFHRSDLQPLAVGASPLKVSLLLEPIAYRFPEGHRVRLRVAGADRDNFFLGSVPGLATQWEVHLAESRVRLPLVH